MKTVSCWDKEIDMKAEQQSCIKFCIKLGMAPVQTRDLLKLTDCARTVSRTLVYPSNKEITDIVLYESERKVMDSCRFHRTINVSNV
jgi:hypothetical protein